MNAIFHDLAQILAERSGVINLHLAADIAPDASKMTMQSSMRRERCLLLSGD
jgi:hypothetical protein